jgi:hypothetical protein
MKLTVNMMQIVWNLQLKKCLGFCKVSTWFLGGLPRGKVHSRIISHHQTRKLRFSCHVRTFLGRNFPARWIGSDPFADPPRSPDFIPLDNVFRVVYRGKVQNVNELRERIVTAAERITMKCFPIPGEKTEYRLDVCRATTGTHTEMSIWESLRGPVFRNI